MNVDIKISDEAYSEAIALQKTKDEWIGQALRLYLDGKGCDGFYYGVTFDDKKEGDLVAEIKDIKILVDPETYEFTKGSEIVWVNDDRGRGFLVNNPNHNQYKGKFFKLDRWKNREVQEPSM